MSGDARNDGADDNNDSEGARADDRVAVTAANVWPDGVDAEEGVVVNWFVRAGRRVDEGENLCEIQVEKVSFDVFAPTGGTLVEVVRGEDAEVEPADTLAWVEPA